MAEDLIMWPWIWWGRRLAQKSPLQKQYDVFMVFPFYHTGGAEKIHSQIAQALKHKKALILFTRRSQNEAFLKAFEASGHDIMDISVYTDHKSRYWNNIIHRGVISGHINAQQIPTVVFNGQSNFGYKLSPWIKPSIPQIELIHSFSSFSFIRVPFLPFITTTVMISQRRIQDHLDLYRRWGIPSSFNQRIRYIVNGVALPEPRPSSKNGIPQKILFVGRGTPEKRPLLAAGIAQHLLHTGLQIRMGFVGDVAAAVPISQYPQFNFYGNVNDDVTLDRIYREDADLLLVTSSEEGFPLVIMEAMARGAVIMATPVGDIPVHVQQDINGRVFSSVNDEVAILREATEFVQQLQNDPEKFRRMSAANIAYAYKTFGLHNFEQQYSTLIENQLH